MQYLLTVVVSEHLLLYALATGIALALTQGIINKATLIHLDLLLFGISAVVCTRYSVRTPTDTFPQLIPVMLVLVSIKLLLGVV